MIKTYKLPDLELVNSTKNIDFLLWQPDKTSIILGRSNNANDSVFIEKAKADNVEIYKRPSGGETVILSPEMLVIAVKIVVENQIQVHKYFKIINDKIIESLASLGIKDLNSKGISDISIGEMKILGSSMFRKPTYIFYHAVLNVSQNIELIEKYLKHPKREPDYRKGRKHEYFVSSLKSEGYNCSLTLITEELIKYLRKLRIDIAL